jgi:sRNA-binding regulator protein Hfq
MKTRWKNAMTFSGPRASILDWSSHLYLSRSITKTPLSRRKKAMQGASRSIREGKKLMTTESITEEVKPKPKRQFEFVPKLRDKKVVVRLASGGQPVTGTLVAQSSYEILIKTTKGSILVFKHAIATIDEVDEPKGYKLDANY